LAELRREKKRQDRHEALHLASRVPNRINKAPAGEQAADGIEQQAHLDTRPGARGEQLHNPAAGVIPPQNEDGDVNGVLRGQNLLFQGGESVFSGRDEADRVTTNGRTLPAVVDSLRHRGIRGDGISRIKARDDGNHGRLARHQPAHLATAEKQIHGNPDVGDQDDRQEPREGIARLPFFAKETGKRD